MRSRTIIAAAASLALALIFLPAPQGDSAAQYRMRFDKESDPVRKAKILVKLSDSQFQVIRSEADSGNTEEGLKDLETLRDECISTHDSLIAKRVDPENKSAGFKELQISVRETLHRLREIIAGLSGEDEKRYAQVRTQFEDLDNQLVHELFPRQPGQAGKQNPKP